MPGAFIQLLDISSSHIDMMTVVGLTAIQIEEVSAYDHLLMLLFAVFSESEIQQKIHY